MKMIMIEQSVRKIGYLCVCVLVVVAGALAHDIYECRN